MNDFYRVVEDKTYIVLYSGSREECIKYMDDNKLKNVWVEIDRKKSLQQKLKPPYAGNKP